MANTKWTRAQEAAIADRGGTLLVSAAAGSGKTAVLTERVLSLLNDTQKPVEADRLLIVTFTNAAAAELRARIALRIEEELFAHPENNRLRRAKMLLPRAHICTIDAFCLDLLHRHFAALDIPPDFTTADAGVVAQLKEEAMGEALELAYENEAFCQFANLYGRSRTDDAAKAAVLQIYNFLRALPNEEESIAHLQSHWQEGVSFGQTPWYAILKTEMQNLIEAGSALASCALQACEEDFVVCVCEAVEKKKTEAAKKKAEKDVVEKFNVFYARIGAIEDAFVEVEKLLSRQDAWDALYTQFAPYRTGETELPGFKGMRGRLVGEHKAQVRALADEATKTFGKLVSLVVCGSAQAEEDRARVQPMLEAVFATVRDFSQRFYAKKCAKKMLEFSDFEHCALRLLREENGKRTALAQSISAQFDAIMVDEYQDTNGLQEAIYRRLARENGDNLFFVGDLKQSIYRFRQADPSIFAHKQASFAPLVQDTPRPYPPEGVPGGDALLCLDANFRSAPMVVSGVNFLFERLMTPTLGGTVYGDGQRLVCGASSAADGNVTLLIDGTGKCEPEQVADAIATLVAKGAVGDASGMVRDGKGGLRPIAYEDCCILLPTRRPFARYEQALHARAIPSYADSDEDLLSMTHIQPLVALLQVIDNPAQDAPLSTVMLSAIFGFTDDDLVRLRAYRKRGSLYGAVLAMAMAGLRVQKQDAQENQNASFADGHKQEPLQNVVQNQNQNKKQGQDQNQNIVAQTPDSFVQKVVRFFNLLSALRTLSHVVAPEELLAEILAKTHYLAIVGAMGNGARRREDITRFTEFVASAGANGIAQLVRNMNATIAAGGLKNSVPNVGKSGCVSIMTIHRSKGLQFPVVFVAQMTHRFNTEDLKKKILLHREAGLGIQLRAGEDGNNYTTAARLALSTCEKQELSSEEMRLLYVALTRAQDKLFMSMSISNAKKIKITQTKTKGVQQVELPSLLEEKLAAQSIAIGAQTEEMLHATMQDFASWVLSAALVHPSCGVLRALAQQANGDAEGLETACQTIAIAQKERGVPEGILDVQFFDEDAVPVAPCEQGQKGLTQAADAQMVAQLKEAFAWRYRAQALTQLPAKVAVTSLVHKNGPIILERPAFMAKNGLTAAEKGTALHAFLEVADFAKFKPFASGIGTGNSHDAFGEDTSETALRAAIRAEIAQQVEQEKLLPDLARSEVLEEDHLVAFFKGEVFARIAAAKEVLCEYAFITGIPAPEFAAIMQEIMGTEPAEKDVFTQKATAQTQGGEIPADYAEEMVRVQGIADLILVYEDHVELLDYKSDHGKTVFDYKERYAKQLALYAKAIDKRFAPRGLRITYQAIYSFDLQKLIPVNES